MVITNIVPLTKKKSLVEFDEEVTCCFYENELKSFGFFAGGEIREEQFHTVMNEIILKRAKKKAMDMLVRTNRTEKEIRDKLVTSYFPEFIIEETILFLNHHKYLNEDMYTENYVMFHSKGKSRIQLRMELVKKGIDDETISNYLELYYNEIEELKYVIQKKKGNTEEFAKKDKDKLIRYLIQKGFRQKDILREIET
ncbi:regulatory protein RecX [Anaeromicropila populeti]|uniref:Regulatory protein RecX n=1 Tax=Anaeromicropila populeti TaxID=37658 RepID=A0A1I6KFT6_9FIRM|nr:regulatory protein RecX [Anaeromicropila populeti]SFR90101.1 regulatory protein [Anaeromicropila populeti]